MIQLATLLLVLIYKQDMQYNQLICQLEGIKLAGTLELNYIYLDVNKCILTNLHEELRKVDSTCVITCGSYTLPCMYACTHKRGCVQQERNMRVRYTRLKLTLSCTVHAKNTASINIYSSTRVLKKFEFKKGIRD